MSKVQPELARIGEEIRRARRVFALCHVAPDGDAIGSLLALGGLLRSQGKQVTLACQDPVPEMYTWLPDSAEIVRRGSGSYDLVISLDCSDERRMGDVYEGALRSLPLVNVDHHVTNTYFGSVNWVDLTAVATAQIVLALAETLGWPLTQPVATCLLTGLVTDTRSFRTANVDAAALRAGLQLVEAGASLSTITQRVLDQRPLASVRLWGEAIDRATLQDGVLWTEVTRPMRQRWSAGENGDSGLANFLSGVREAQIVVVLTERDDGSVDVGMRSVLGYDVSGVALNLGGGGHPQASGCTLHADLGQAREQVLAEVQRYLAQRACEARGPSG
jgi:phosphoesterase RecJ-like protein